MADTTRMTWANGLLGGASGGAADAAVNFKIVLRNCMIERGHRVLN